VGALRASVAGHDVSIQARGKRNVGNTNIGALQEMAEASKA
jgi:hypothetical protein